MALFRWHGRIQDNTPKCEVITAAKFSGFIDHLLHDNERLREENMRLSEQVYELSKQIEKLR